MTYADEGLNKAGAVKDTHFIRIPKLSYPESLKSSSAKDTSHQAETEEIAMHVEAAKKSLAQVIRRRVTNNLRTNTIVQNRVNQRLLRGFKGFHGELTELWDQSAEDARENVVRQKAMDQFWKEKQETKRKVKDDSSQQNATDFGASPGKDIELPQVGKMLEKTEITIRTLKSDIAMSQKPACAEVGQNTSSDVTPDTVSPSVFTEEKSQKYPGVPIECCAVSGNNSTKQG